MVEQYVDYVESSVLDEKTTGGWNIDPSIFNNQTYGVYGIKKPKFRHIDTLDFSKVFLKVGLSSTSYGAAGATFSFASTGDKLNQGNIIFTSFSFLEYCNSVYRMSELVNVANANLQPLSSLRLVGQSLHQLLEPRLHHTFLTRSGKRLEL